MNVWNPTEREKAEMILKVRSGLMTATDAAKAMGVSRKTYYKWERKGLEAMMEGLCERNSGRPPGEKNGQAEKLKKRIRELESELERRDKLEELREKVKQLSEKKE